MKILEAISLKKYFPIRSGVFLQVCGNVKALEKADIKIEQGQTIGVVGESGCGKSTLGKLLLKLYDPTDGKIIYTDKENNSYDITSRICKTVASKFRRDVQMIFQNPFDSLDPRMNIYDIIKEPIAANGMYKNKREMNNYIASLLTGVGLYPEYASRYPHEFSGGQRQRIAIARAMAVMPRLIVCDEPTSALDVSVQSQIINLLKHIQQENRMSLIFISHNLDVVHHMSDRIIVMYLGNIVESCASEELFNNPLHPYTKTLMSCIPAWNPKEKKLGKTITEGEPPSPINPPNGCPFHPRCQLKMIECEKVKPLPHECGDGHSVACHLYKK